jgi:hypothetical protein
MSFLLAVAPHVADVMPSRLDRLPSFKIDVEDAAARLRLGRQNGALLGAQLIWGAGFGSARAAQPLARAKHSGLKPLPGYAEHRALLAVWKTFSSPPRMTWANKDSLAADILHGFPILECGFNRQKVSMFVVVRMLLDGSACPRKAATACWPNRIFRKDLRQGISELVAKG